jgi:predicted hydrocarbon binding protein
MNQAPAKVRAARLEEFYRLDYKTGAVLNQLTEERVQVIPVVLWKVLRQRLAEEFREKALAIDSEIGSILGSSFSEQIMEFISDPEMLLKRMSEIAAAAGWGVFSILGDTRYGTKFTVTVANCAFCDNQGLSDSPQCDFLIGVIKGITETVFGTPHRVSEVECAVMGECVCQIEVEETGEELPQLP